MKIQWKPFLISLAIPLGIGLIAGALIRDSVTLYSTMEKPFLAPPSWLFPIVWTVLYLLMGISSYLIWAKESNPAMKKQALITYATQLFLNFIWPLIFFNRQNYLMAFTILLALWYFVFRMIQDFNAIHPLAGKLQIPYLLWLTFAAYLNLAAYLLIV